MSEQEKTELEKYKESHSLEKLEGVIIYDKPTIKTGDKTGCIGALLLLLGFGIGLLTFVVGLFIDFNLKGIDLLWETIAALGIVFSLSGSFRIGELPIHTLPLVADKEKNFSIESAFHLYNILYKPSKTVLLHMIARKIS